MRKSWTTVARAAAMLGALACGDAAKPPVAPIVVADQPPSPSSSPSASAAPATSPSSSAAAEEAPPRVEAPPAPAASDAPSGSMSGSSLVTTLGGDAGVTPGPVVHGAGRSPTLRQGAVTITGKLPPEVIQRIVRQNFGRYRLCYENGLRTNKTLSGTIAVKFTISRAGDVSKAADASSNLPDKNVVACVVKGFANLSFPQPESGEVSVVYPIIFSAPEDAPKK